MDKTKFKSFANIDLLHVADAVAREKSISKEMVLVALEETIKSTAKYQYGHQEALRVRIDRKNGEISIFREMIVVEDGEENETQNKKKFVEQARRIPVSTAKLKEPNAKVGDLLLEQLPPIDPTTIEVQSAKNILSGKVNEIKREKEYQDFKERIGEVVNGVIAEKLSNGYVVKVGSTDAIIKKDQLLKSDHYRTGDRIRAYLVTIDRNTKDQQLILSRKHDQFLVQLFTQEVPEMYDKIIEIKKVVRDPGSRSKVAVYTSDSAIDPLGSCIGVKGSRIHPIISELNGEKIDIVLWSHDIAQFVINAIAPVQVSKIIIDEDNNRIEAVVLDSQQSSVIGRRGQNIRLVSKLVGWNISILTETQEASRRQADFKEITEKFTNELDLDSILAQLLASEGYSSINELADSTVEKLSNIQGLEESIGIELIDRARDYVKNNKNPQKSSEAKAISAVIEESNTREISNILSKAGIKTLREIADLSIADLEEILEEYNISALPSKDVLSKLILSARNKVYFSHTIKQ